MDSRNPYSSMWAEACALLDEAERLQRQFFRPAGPRQAGWEPPVDLFADDERLLIVAALPGVRAEQIELLFNGAELIIAGRRALPAESTGLAVWRMEIPAGRFERRIALPPGRYDVSERRFVDGCLTLTLRRL